MTYAIHYTDPITGEAIALTNLTPAQYSETLVSLKVSGVDVLRSGRAPLKEAA